MIWLSLLEARARLHSAPERDGDGCLYLNGHGIDVKTFRGKIGFWAITDITDCGGGRFDFAEDGEAAFVIEALGEDGETVVDLVAWPIGAPERVLTMFGRCGLLGLAEALCPTTFFIGCVLDMHRTPLDWLKAGCRGAVVVTAAVASREIVNVMVPIAARDHQHGQELQSVAALVTAPQRFVVGRGAS